MSEVKLSEKKTTMIVEASTQIPGAWVAERIDDDGGIEQAIFIGPRARERAMAHSLAKTASVAEAVERGPCQICQDILLIEESRQAGDSTPGGFEHMGDVWRQITEWAAAIRNRKE